MLLKIAELRDNIGTLSDILIETKTAFEDVKKTIASSGGQATTDASVNAVQDEILKELSDKFDNRRNVFHVMDGFCVWLKTRFNYGVYFYSNDRWSWPVNNCGIAPLRWAIEDRVC